MSAVTLVVSLALPTVFFQALKGPEEVYSIYGGVESLWDDGSHISAAIVFVFSIVFPAGKLFFLLWLCLRPELVVRPELGGSKLGGSERVLRTLVVLGKWSLVDVFIIGLFVGSFLPVGYAASDSRSGIHLFAVAILLSMIAARLVAVFVSVEEDRSPPSANRLYRLRGVLSVVSLVLLALGLRQAYYLIEPITVFGISLVKDKVGLADTIGAMWSHAERAMAIYFVLALLVAPTLRALLALALALFRRAALRVWADRLDECAMLDVFLLSLVLVYDKLTELTSTSLLVGFWYLAAAAVVGLFDAIGVRCDRGGVKVGGVERGSPTEAAGSS